jgi:hypothetical protein
MANSVLGTYIDRNAKSNTRSWRGFGRKMSSRRYRLEKAQEAAIGEGHLAEIIGGYLRGNPEWPEEKRRNIPDCLDICGPVESRGFFYELYIGSWAAVASFGTPLRSSRPLLAGCLTYSSLGLMRKTLRDVLMDSSNGGMSDGPCYMQRHSSNG